MEIIEVQEECKVDEEKKWHVYVHTNKQNNCKYVGITSQNPMCRWHGGSGYKCNVYFYRAIQKYGWDEFDHEIIASGLTKEEACELEKSLIEKYKSPEEGGVYNLTNGGEGTAGRVITDEFRKKIRQANLGKKHTLEAKKKMSDARKGIPLSNETKKKMSIAHSGDRNPFYGKKLSEEHKQHLRDSHIGIAITPEWKQKIIDGQVLQHAVYCVELNLLYKGPSAAGKATNINYRHISECCKEVPHRKTAGGYHWMYADKAVENEYITQAELDIFLSNFKLKKENDDLWQDNIKQTK